MDKLKLETMKALMEALPSLARSGAKRIKYGEFEVEFHEPTARRIIETVQQPADVTYQMRVEHADGTVTAPTTPVQVEQPAEEVPADVRYVGQAKGFPLEQPPEPEEEDEEPGDPLFHHLPPSQRPSIS